MLNDPYAVLRALLRAEAARRTPAEPEPAPQPPRERRPPARDKRRD
ncbi:hypothetical protein [Streptomyces flaveolus]